MTPKAIFIGDNTGLDFVNTLAAPHSEVIEYIPDGRALLAWLLDARLITEADQRLLLTRFSPAQIDLAAARARALRELTLATLRDIKAGIKQPATMAPLMHELNALFALDPRYTAAELVDGQVQLRQQRQWDHPEQLLAVIAEAIGALFARPDFTLVRKCAGPTCMLWFEDKTKAHRRQYCSPEACGNRAKVAAFRQRRKAQDNADISGS